jgi:butyryl-CoA dehydrogenase
VVQETIEGLQEIRELAHQFATDRLRPNVERWDHDAGVDAGVQAQLAELGFHGMLVPEAHGGLEFPLATCAAVLEEIAWGEPAMAFALLASASVATFLAGRGGPASAWLEALASGERTGGIAIADSAGSLEASPDGNSLRLDGHARWVLRSGGPDVLVLAAGGSNGDRRVAVPGEANGLTTTERESTLGLRPARIDRIRLAAVDVDPAVCAEAGRSRIVEWIGTAAIAVGIARAALEHATGYAAVREQFNRRLRAFQGIRVKLADMSVRVSAARALTHEAALTGSPAAAAAAKVFASEAAMDVTTQAVQVFGGYGYMRDYPVEKTMRDAKATEIFNGTNDQCREVVAAALYSD